MNVKFWQRMRVKGQSSGMDKLTACLAEFLGTAILLFVGCMGSTFGRANTFLESALAFGLAVMIAIQCFGHISGAHVNPILSIAAMIAGILPLIDCLLYLLAQFVGAICGFGLLKVLIPNRSTLSTERWETIGMCSVSLDYGVDKIEGMFIEFFITFILVLVICGVWDYKNRMKVDSTPLRFGLAVTGLLIGAGPYTSGGLNPARVLAPAIFNNYWHAHWIYWAGELLGGIIAAILYIVLFTDDNSSRKQDVTGASEDA